VITRAASQQSPRQYKWVSSKNSTIAGVGLPPRVVIADRGDAGRRVDLVIRRHLTDLQRATRTRVQGWIESGRVSINGRIVRRVSDKAALGDVVQILLPDETPRREPMAEEGTLDVLYEDQYLLAATKPAGMVSHPTYRHPSGSLLNVLLWHARAWPDGSRPSLVGRLDKLTSGIVVVAKTTDAHARMQRTLASARSEKAYLAIVHGPVDEPRGTIEFPLQRDPTDRRRVVVAQQGGLASVTRFERLAQTQVDGAVMALVRCQLVTGRMHQLRVHLAARSWPIAGDAKYLPGSRAGALTPDHPARAIGRQALHAWRVRFTHPFTGAIVDVTSPLPDDMRRLCEACGLKIEDSSGFSRTSEPII
jgi:23S rRNA pseudouridine1911/1915/1917 synthase